MRGERNAESVDGSIDSRWGGVDICSAQCRGRAFREAGASRDLFKKDVVRFGRVAADARAEVIECIEGKANYLRERDR